MFIIHILSNGSVAAAPCCAQIKVVADYTMFMCRRYKCFQGKLWPLFISLAMLESRRTGQPPLIIALHEKLRLR